jgi:hypothetical protein
LEVGGKNVAQSQIYSHSNTQEEKGGNDNWVRRRTGDWDVSTNHHSLRKHESLGYYQDYYEY